MNCHECLELIDAFVDEELSPGETDLMSGHLKGCDECRQVSDELRALLAKFSKVVPSDPPAHLGGNILATLDEFDRENMNREALSIRPTGAQNNFWRLAKGHAPVAALGAALSATLGAILSALVLYFALFTPLTRAYETREIVSAHIRSLMGRELIDVASADTHVLRPWFAGKLDFAPYVVSLADAGFQLKGARTDYLFGKRIAALVYFRRAHKINLFILPASAGAYGRSRTYQVSGYNVEEISREEFRYIAISDLNAKELRDFARLIKPAP